MLSLSLALAIGAVPAAIQGDGTPALDRAVIATFARCVAAKRQTESRRYVLHRYADNWRASDWDFRKLKDGACVPPQISKEIARSLRNISEDTLKMALAGVLVRQELGHFDASLIATAQPLPNATLVDKLWVRPEACDKCEPEQLKDLAHAREVSNAKLAPFVFSECAVRTDPARAHELLMTELDSAAERLAFNSLASAFSQCVAPDKKISASRGVLRGFIALIYYRVANAPRVGSSGAPK